MAENPSQGGERPRRRPLWLPGWEAAREAQGLGPSQVATSRRQVQVWLEEKVPRLWCALMLFVLFFDMVNIYQHLYVFWFLMDTSGMMIWFQAFWFQKTSDFDGSGFKWKKCCECERPWISIVFFDGFCHGQNLGSLQHFATIGEVTLHQILGGCKQQKWM